MKVFVQPTCGVTSTSMFRVAHALRKYKPIGVEIVQNQREADLVVLHTIGPWQQLPNQEYVVIQYCLETAGAGRWSGWPRVWRRARLVWSYYDMTRILPAGAKFFYAPLRVDGSVFRLPTDSAREILAMTTGYVSGPGAEAIEEVAEAACIVGGRVVHLGPAVVEGMSPRVEASWKSYEGIEDPELVDLYGRSRWVSGLRRVEGFELPVIEGLACGARPIVFDRPEMRYWYGPHAIFVPEVPKSELIPILAKCMSEHTEPVSFREREEVLQTFDWQTIVREFWRRLQ